MSDINPQAAASAAEDQFANMSDEDALGSVWDDANTADSQARDEGGRYASNADGEGGGEEAVENGEAPAAEGGEGGAEATDEVAAAASAVALPPNWNGMDEDWKKIPPDVQAKIAERDAQLHARMSDQGRTISAFRPVADVFERNRDLIEGRVLDDGRPITPQLAVDFLLSAQRQLETDPVRAVIDIATRFDVLPILADVLSGKLHLPPAPQPQQPAGMTPAAVQEMVQGALAADQQARTANEEVSRLSADKPLYADIAEGDMVHAIHKARSKLGDTASNQAVFDLAYDIAVNADPDLRAKAAAAAKPAAAPDTRRRQDARRAASINVQSSETGRGRRLTEDEELASAFDAAHKG